MAETTTNFATKCHETLIINVNGGGDRIRTGVQTYSPKAFYMLILLLIVGNEQEKDQPIQNLAA